MRRTANVAQITVVLLLVWAAYWAALPWINCIRAFPTTVPVNESVRFCTFGTPGIPGFVTPYGWNLLAGALYVAAAIWVSIRRP